MAEQGILKVNFLQIYTWHKLSALEWVLIFTTKFRAVVVYIGVPLEDCSRCPFLELIHGSTH